MAVFISGRRERLFVPPFITLIDNGELGGLRGERGERRREREGERKGGVREGEKERE